VKKIILISVLIAVLIISLGVIYLNNVIFPTKAKSWIIDGISAQTGKKVTLESVRINIFRGLTLKNLDIYDDSMAVIKIKEVSCGFLIFPMLQKRLVIPLISVSAPAVFLERYPDNTFNLEKLFTPVGAKTQDKKPGFNVSVYRISVNNANLYFQDDTLSPPLKKEIKKINSVINLSLPSSVKFKLTGQIPSQLNSVLKASGEYRIPVQEFSAKVNLADFSPQDAEPYYRNSGLAVPKGKIDADLGLEYKKNRLAYSGKLSILGCRIEGLQFVKALDNISGDIIFNNAGLSAEKLNATLGALPVQANIKLIDYSKPVLNVNIAQIGLDRLPEILKSGFDFDFPGSASGSASFTLNARAIPDTGAWSISGYVDTSGARLNLDRLPWAVVNLTGRIKFSPDRIDWEGLRFLVNGIQYKATGSWQNFISPRLQVVLESENIRLKASFKVKGTEFDFSEFIGAYLNSEFSATGIVDTKNPNLPFADISGSLDLNLEDLKKIFVKAAEQLDKAKLQGMVAVDFNFKGKTDSFKNCFLQARASSPAFSAYGLKSENFSFDYTQSEGAGNITGLILPFYSGLVQGSAVINFKEPKLPYQINLILKGVRIEKFKADTPAKDQDIAGKVDADFKLNGLFDDISKLNGSGDINVSEGKLWQLNLFKGLGSLLFVRDFTNIIFTKGSCKFKVEDKLISTDNLVLRSDITDLDGKVKIGFDSTIDAYLNVHILNESVPLSGTFKDVATAIIGRAGRFGVIKITGTLKEPKNKFEPAVGDILIGLKNMIIGN